MPRPPSRPLPASRFPLPASRLPLAAAALGFTIVEVIVALTLLATGALAVVAASAVAVRTVGEAETQLFAEVAARNRLETLAARGCAESTSGSATNPSLRVREWWKASAPRNGVRLLSESLEYVERGDPRRIARRRLVIC